MTDDYIMRHDGQDFHLEAIEQPKISDYLNDSDVWFGLSEADLVRLFRAVQDALNGKAPRAELYEDA